MPNERELFEQANQLNNDEQYSEVVSLLSDELLEKHKSADLYAEKAHALHRVKRFDASWNSSEMALEIDRNHAKANTIHGNHFHDRKMYDKAIEAYKKAIQTDPNLTLAHHGLGLTYQDLKDNEKALEQYRIVINIDPEYKHAYNNIGNIYLSLEEYNTAVEYFLKSLELDPRYLTAHYNLGILHTDLFEYEKAIKYYQKAIKLKPEYVDAHNNLGVVYHRQKKFDRAIEYYQIGIKIDPNNSLLRFNIGDSYFESSQYKLALANFQKKIDLSKDKPDYLSSVAEERIEEIKKILENKDFEEINSLITHITELLLFQGHGVTHYTSLSTAKALILEESNFRLSEGTFLNDTAEGKELFEFLNVESSFSTDLEINDSFSQKPFIGSFVAESKFNDLTLWRMYGKENQEEAKGCTLTIGRKNLLDSILSKLIPDEKKESSASDEQELSFYRVAYIDQTKKSSIVIPGARKSDVKALNELMRELKEKVDQFNQSKHTDQEDRKNLLERLNEIAYLFKSVEYQYENEIRLVIKGIGFEKKIDVNGNPPRVYIETVHISDLIKQITLGPKVERAEEWVAAFHYAFEKKGLKPKISSSQLPFK